MTDTTTPMTAGMFRATCRKAEWRNLEDVADPQPDAQRRYHTTRSRAGTQTVEQVEVRCDFATTDRAEFERHMKEAHNRTPGRHMTDHRGHAGGFNPRRWKAPSAPKTAKVWKDDKRTRTCETCGTVAEIAIDGTAEHDCQISF